MNRILPSRLVWLLWCFALFACDVSAAAEKYTVRAPELRLPPGESIVSLEIHLADGSFCNALNLPPGWHFEFDNDPSWQTSIKGSVLVGAAWLTPEEFSKLQFVVEKGDLPDAKLALSGTVSTTKNYDKTTNTTLHMSDFKLAPAN